MLVIAAAALILIFTGFLVLNSVQNLAPESAPEYFANNSRTTGEGELEISDLLDRYQTMVIAENDTMVTILDERGREVVLEKGPDRVILLQNTLLDLWYLAGGKAVSRVSGTTSVPQAALDLPEVGNTTTPNVELILAQNPDLVVMNAWTSSHVELVPILDENDIPYFFTGTSITPYENVMKALYAFTRLTGDEEAYHKNMLTIAEEVDQIIAQIPDGDGPDVLVLFGSSKWVKAEMENGLVGEMVSMLGANNVVKTIDIEGESKVDFSLESVVEADPDYILVTAIGNMEAARDRLYEDMANNEAWASLTAVQNGEVHFLPKDLYLYKPNARYPEALQGLMEILYP